LSSFHPILIELSTGGGSDTDHGWSCSDAQNTILSIPCTKKIHTNHGRSWPENPFWTEISLFKFKKTEAPQIANSVHKQEKH
jgi:hypothetical protein